MLRGSITSWVYKIFSKKISTIIKGRLQLCKKYVSAPITEVITAKKIKILAAAGTWKTLSSIKNPTPAKKINASTILMIAEK